MEITKLFPDLFISNMNLDNFFATSALLKSILYEFPNKIRIICECWKSILRTVLAFHV